MSGGDCDHARAFPPHRHHNSSTFPNPVFDGFTLRGGRGGGVSAHTRFVYRCKYFAVLPAAAVVVVNRLVNSAEFTRTRGPRRTVRDHTTRDEFSRIIILIRFFHAHYRIIPLIVRLVVLRKKKKKFPRYTTTVGLIVSFLRWYFISFIFTRAE